MNCFCSSCIALFSMYSDSMAQRLARRAEDPRFQSHPRLTFQSCPRYQLNQLGSEAASESTFKKSNTCGVSNTRLYFFSALLHDIFAETLLYRIDAPFLEESCCFFILLFSVLVMKLFLGTTRLISASVAKINTVRELSCRGVWPSYTGLYLLQQEKL